MKRLAVCVLTMMTLVLPAQAQAPMVMIAKDLVKGIIQSFVQDRLISMLSTMGPCGMPLGPTGGLATLAGLLGGGGMPGVGALASLPGMTGLPAMPGLPALTGADGPGSLAGIGAAGSAVGAAGAAAQLAAMPSKANPCKPGELTQVLHSAADVPMGSGMLRMMLQPMRDMALSVDEAHDRLTQMSATESAEYVAQMAEESRGWDAENRKAFIGMAETNFLGMPAPMRAQLVARLKRRD